MVTDAGVEHFGSMLVSVPYIWTELRHVLKGLTPTCVNKNLEKFLALLRPLRASSVFAAVFAQQRAQPTCTSLSSKTCKPWRKKMLGVEVTTDENVFSMLITC